MSDANAIQKADPRDNVSKIHGDDLRYGVKRIVASRIQHGELQYQAEWDQPEPDHDFYPAFNFHGVSLLLDAFHNENPGQAGPSVRLEVWLEAGADGKVVEEHRDDDKAQFPAEVEGEWGALIQIDATDPELNYQHRRLEDIVSTLIHEMVHALLFAYICDCNSCEERNLSTDRLIGKELHGHVFRRMMAGIQETVRSWSPSLQGFTIDDD